MRACPWESVHRSEEGLTFEAETLQVRRSYAAVGLQAPALNKREIAVFLPLVLITLWMGIYPNSFLDPMAPAVDKLIGDYNAALKLARTAALP